DKEYQAMRKQANKLYYLLELDNPADRPAMKNLKQLQTVTGDIHDCDVTLAFLNQYAGLIPHTDALTKTEQRKRHSCYKKLLTQLNKEPWEPLRKLASN
ncbi:MAG: CHAD domain-containing protein, partial [Gammaproteobacteria bacterium]|nr:CHAD domain-containing protein [Gammaproteobacteria bacterium]